MTYLKILSILIFFISCQNPEVKIVRVWDGDTYTTSTGETIRLANVDCPELNQNFGIRTRDLVIGLILNKQVEVIRKDRDKYGRTIAEIRIDGKFLDEILVDNGLAWTYSRYSTESLIAKKRIAKQKRLGIWSEPHPIPPYLFRSQN